jgi:hypothetical protein
MILRKLKYLITGKWNTFEEIHNMQKPTKEDTHMNLKEYAKFDTAIMKRTLDDIFKSISAPSTLYAQLNNCDTLSTVQLKEILQEPSYLSACTYKPIKCEDLKVSCKIVYEIEESKRYVSHGKHNGEEIPTVTTKVFYMGKVGEATIDKDKYNRRQGILEALANACYGNFESLYTKIEKAEKKKEREELTCPVCGKHTATKEEFDKHSKIHEEAKAKRKAKKEYRKIKQAAMRRLADMEREEAIQKELDRLLSEKNKDITNS